MGLFQFGTLPADDVAVLVELANAAYADESPPEGWTTLTADALDFQGSTTRGSFEGDYYIPGVSALFLSAARIMQKDDTLVVSFRGTDTVADFLLYPELLNTDLYVQNFAPLLAAVSAYASKEGITDIQVTGHSLGAAAVNQFEDLAARDVSKGGTDYGNFADATFVAFASPQIYENANVLNVGFEDDWVFKAVERSIFAPNTQPDYDSATNNIVWFDDNYASSGFAWPVFNPYSDTTAHHIPNYISAAQRIIASTFYDEMDRNSVVIVVDTDLQVTDKKSPTSDHFGDPAFYIGRDVADDILGGAKGDYIDGFDGDDILEGAGGNDLIDGGGGLDRAVYRSVSGDYTISVKSGGAVVITQVAGDLADGSDELTDVERAVFTDTTINIGDQLTLPDTPAFLLVGSAQDDFLRGGRGDDHMRGMAGDDSLDGRRGDDGLVGGRGDDLARGGEGDDTILGENGDDRLKGGDGMDIVTGGRGGDAVYGGRGQDRLEGGDGRDFLRGGHGEDWLDGGNGLDKLMGGTGPDRFVLADAGHADKLLDFDAAEDELVFEGDYAGLELTDFDLVASNSGVRLELDGAGVAHVANVSPAQLLAEDLALV